MKTKTNNYTKKIIIIIFENIYIHREREKTIIKPNSNTN